MERFRNSKFVRRVAPWVAAGTLVAAGAIAALEAQNKGEALVYDPGCSSGVKDPNLERGIYFRGRDEGILISRTSGDSQVVTFNSSGDSYGVELYVDVTERTQLGDIADGTWYNTSLEVYVDGGGAIKTPLGGMEVPIQSHTRVVDESHRRVCVNGKDVYVAP